MRVRGAVLMRVLMGILMWMPVGVRVLVGMRVLMGVVFVMRMGMAVTAAIGMHMIVFMAGRLALYSHFASAAAAGGTHWTNPS